MREIKCPNCGASFDAKLPKCPYCDYINPEGAEDKFFDSLEGTKADLKTLVDAPEAGGSYAEEIKKSSAGIARKTAIIAVIIVLFILIGVGLDRALFGMGNHNKDYSKELAWQNEHFTELDELYVNEEYDEAIALVEKYEDAGHEMWHWNHCAFIDNIRRYNDMQFYLEQLDGGSSSKDIGSVLLYDVLYFCYRAYDGDVMEQDDLMKLDEISIEARDIAHKRFKLSDEMLDEFKSEVFQDGYVDFKKTEKLAAKYYKNFQ